MNYALCFRIAKAKFLWPDAFNLSTMKSMWEVKPDVLKSIDWLIHTIKSHNMFRDLTFNKHINSWRWRWQINLENTTLACA